MSKQQEAAKNELKKSQQNQPEQRPVRQRPITQTDEPKKKKKVHLSFEDEEAQDHQVYKVKKNPTLSKEPNPNDKLQQIRKSSNGSNLEQIIKAEYIEKIDKLKQELIEFQYRYWEGGELIKKLRRKKKEKVRDLLEACRIELVSSFKELAQMTSDDLLFVMKDFIIPHEMALYEIEALELKTKKNELVMNLRPVKIKKDSKEITLSVNIDSPVRIIDRLLYEKHKQGYPFCNWETLKISSSK